MNDRDDYLYSDKVCCQINDKDYSSYQSAARYINSGNYDVLSVQHEYGIFGGEAGSYLMALVREVNIPIVTTLHTVLSAPSPAQKAVLDELLQLSERVIVMSEKAVSLLEEVHSVPPEKVDLIPHGIPVVSEIEGAKFRESLGIDGAMILTFGLLSPDKGIQYAIEAMPKIVAEHPSATYVIVGATHPHVRASSGEAYRESLQALAEELGVTQNIRFVDRFVDLEELVLYLGAMDYYVTPYLNPHQITSGTLAYSVGAGKVVISTPYWYAEEILADGRGRLVPFRDANAIADTIIAIEGNAELKAEMGRSAAEFGKHMHWPEVGKMYLKCFERAKKDNAERLPFLSESRRDVFPALKLQHLFALSDDTGIVQHATFNVPNRAEGYCVDDNARALLLTAFLEDDKPLSEDMSLLQSRYLSFVLDAYNPANGRFRNFMSYQRQWLEEEGSEDSHGRSLWALGAMVGRSQNRGRRDVAKELFKSGMEAMYKTRSLRTWAYGVLGADEYLQGYPLANEVQAFGETMAERILQEYKANESASWPWFEQKLAYANARLPQALFLISDRVNNVEMLSAGVRSLSWLMGLQHDDNGVFLPIATPGLNSDSENRSLFDQQPIEAWSSMSACISAHRVTGNPFWLGEAHRAFRWFLGGNLLKQPLYDQMTGGCHDGLHSNRVNQNQGAESTLSFLCALVELQAAALRPSPSIRPSQAHEIFQLRSPSPPPPR